MFIRENKVPETVKFSKKYLFEWTNSYESD